jgi:hypothetical protein
VPLTRRFVLAVALVAMLLPFFGQTSQPSGNRSGQQQQSAQSKPKCTDNGTYVNSKGETVKRPESCSAAPEGATAQCRDGSYSFSRNHRGTCSRHGGVAKWL